MSAITSIDLAILLASGGGAAPPQSMHFFKDARVGGAAAGATVAGRFNSMWLYGGMGHGPGSAPGAIAIPTRATNGALGQANPTGGRQLWCAGGVIYASQPGTLICYDRLAHISGLSGTVTSQQIVQNAPASPALTRYTNGIGNQIWAEIYNQIGASSTTITAEYTDEAGNTGQTSEAAGIGNTGLREVQRMIPITLAAGDRGVQAVKGVTLAATTGTAGDFGITIAHPLFEVPIPAAGVSSLVDLVTTIPALPEIPTDACLAWMFLANGTAVPQSGGFLQLLEY